MKIFKVIIFFLTLFVLDIPAYAESVSLGNLINQPDKYDQKTITFEAEVIGEPLSTQSGNWFNVTCGSYHIGIFFKDKDLINQLKYWGSYRQRGDIVQVKGVFYKNCPAHSQSGVHLISLELVKRGMDVSYPISSGKIKFAFLSFVICLTMAAVYFIKVRWQKKLKN